MEKYIIQGAYPEGFSKYNEIEIKSDSLLYIEIGDSGVGCQSINTKNNKEILLRCKKIADLIREINFLNK